MPGVDHGRVLWEYRGTARNLVVRAKDHGGPAAHALRAMLRGLLTEGETPHCWCVPPPSLRRRRRNWYLPRFLADGLAAADGVRVRPLLRRVALRPAQVGLDGSERRRNLEGVFAARDGRVPARVAILDDVLTTGATLSECARALRAAGAVKIQVVAVTAAASELGILPGEGARDRARLRIPAWTST